MLPDKMEHCIVFMNSWDVSGVFWSFSKCNIKIPHLPADPSTPDLLGVGGASTRLKTHRKPRTWMPGIFGSLRIGYHTNITPTKTPRFG